MIEPKASIPRIKHKSAGKHSSAIDVDLPELVSLPEATKTFLESVFLLSPFLEDCARK